ncbi:MAG: hypothetical protein ACLT38_11585 [Akkermansia sp.]
MLRYHPKLAVAGSCRMCMVEQGCRPGSPGQTPSYDETAISASSGCPAPSSPAQTRWRKTWASARTAPASEAPRRNGILLTSHPLDCPICDQAGECKLQEYSNDYGQVEGRFEEKRPKRKT